tara:strand:- start:57 stop:299 length:243 start_codon:yes stop_codon:yes gene_type:complete
MKTDKIKQMGIDPRDLKTALFCHWEMEKLDYHLDRMKSYLVDNRLPRSLTNLVIEDIEEARDELKNIFEYLYKKEGRLDK